MFSCITRAESIENQVSELPFSFFSVKRKELNFSYFPNDTDKYGTFCITVKTKPINGRIVFTFYSTEQYPRVNFRYRNIVNSDQDHEAMLHKRINPLSPHYHYEIGESEDPDIFVFKILNKLGFKGDCKRFLYTSAQHFYEFPYEPGLIFQDGSHSENSGARTFDEKDNEENIYIQGPGNLYKEAEV